MTLSCFLNSFLKTLSPSKSGSCGTPLCSSLSLSSASRGDRSATQPAVTGAWLSALGSCAHTSPGLAVAMGTLLEGGLIRIKRISG